MKRFVLDPNALASGIIDPSSDKPPRLLFDALENLTFEVVVCPKLLGEVRKGAIDAEEEVGMSALPVVEEGGLVDDVGPVAHRLLGAGDRVEQGGVGAVAVGNFDNPTPRGLQGLQVPLLVRFALAGEQLGVRSPLRLDRQLARCPRQVERRQVVAGEEVVEIARRYSQLSVQ